LQPEEPTLDDLTPLIELGYSARWQALFVPYDSQGLIPGRVVRSDRGSALVATSSGIVRATPTARLAKAAAGPGDLPAAGDWVALTTANQADTPQMDSILDRASAIVRGNPGKRSQAQILAANVDIVFIVHPIATGANLRRLERELSLVWESGAVPVVLLTKADLSPDPGAALRAVEAITPGVDVLLVNALTGDCANAIKPYLAGNRTAVLIGPSGAGKSTITNAVLGEQRQATQEVRISDGRGRHTTVARELVKAPGGGVLIDTPGLRALGLVGSEEGISITFPDIDELATACRYRDCTHHQEPSCAVQAAVEAGSLPPERLASYHKLIREAQVAAARTDARLRSQEERRWKTIAKAVREFYKHDDR
jgi:ribosome biogenesis GTPase